MARLRKGDYGRAKRLAEQGLALFREVDDKQGASLALYTLAMAAQGECDYEQARELFEEGLALAAEVEEKVNVVYCMEGLAAIAASGNAVVRAARLWGAADEMLETIEATAYPSYAPDRSLYQSQVNAARTRLGEEAFAAAWAEGREMSFEQAVEYALEDDEASPA